MRLAMSCTLRGPRWLLATIGGLLSLVASATAADFSWQAIDDATFSQPSNWSPASGIPGPADRAIFDRGQDAQSNVLFNTNPVNTQLLIRYDDVTFLLAGRTYTLTGASPAVPSVIVGDADNPRSDLWLDGGTLQTVNSAIGWAEATDAAAVVDAATWTASQGFVIGASGFGRLDILGGGSVQNQFAILGDQATADGTVSIAEGSSWTSSQQILVGGDGVGEFNVEDGGTASAGQAIVANGATSTGFLTVTGIGSQLSVTQPLVVGNAGYGRLDIFDGGRVISPGASLAVAADSSGIVAVSGDAAQWQITGDLNVGGSDTAPGGAGTLFIESGATIDMSGTTLIWPEGFVSLRGGTLRTRAIDNRGSIEYLFGTLHLTASDFTIGAAGMFGASLAISPGMDMIVDRHTAIDPDALLAIIDGSYTAGTLDQQGRVAIIEGALSVRGGGTNHALGKIRAIDSVLEFPAVATQAFVNLGQFDLIDTDVSGALNSPAGSTINIGGSVRFSGPVRGGANFLGSGIVQFDGNYDPGDGIGRVLFDGDVTLGADNDLRLDLGGTAPGQHDQLDVFGHVTLGGTLNLVLAEGYVPQNGHEFPLILYGSTSGSFSDVDYPPIADGLSWRLAAESDALTLAVLSSQMPGDIDGDGDVDRTDFRQFMTHYGRTSGATWSQGDFTGDGRTTLADLVMLRNHLSSSPSPDAAAVPEPGGLATAILAIASALLWRRRSMERFVKTNGWRRYRHRAFATTRHIAGGR
jgi:T5SS/PEP-CTERM-associated repeat protein